MENLAGHIGIFFIAGIVMISVPLVLNLLISSKKEIKKTNYECGEEPIGQNRLQFKIHYFLIAVLFIIFEVEVIYIVPWAVLVEEMGIQALIVMGIFLGILTIGFIYAFVKKAIEWK